MKSKLYTFVFVFLTFLLSLAFIQTCESDTTDPKENADVTGSWEITTTIMANTFGLPNGETNTTILYLESNDVINSEGDWGQYSVNENEISFSGSEISDDFDTTATLVTDGTGTVSGNQLTGNMSTEVYITQPVSSNNPDGIINFSFVMSKMEESPCFDRASFGDPSTSVYIMPYPVGKEYEVYQSYCWRTSGHRNQLAYDFIIPIGDTIIAARTGVVKGIKEDSPDNGEGEGQHNFVYIQHDDGTAAVYAHLMQYSVIVSVNDTVELGEYFAQSGNSGESGVPHLHIGVYQNYPPVEGVDVPFNFRNAQGQLDERNGLIKGEFYRALPY